MTPKHRTHRKRRAFLLFLIPVLVVAAGAFDAQAAALDRMAATQEDARRTASQLDHLTGDIVDLEAERAALVAAIARAETALADQHRMLTDPQFLNDLSDCLSGAYQMLHSVSVRDTADTVFTGEMRRACDAVGVAVGP